MATRRLQKEYQSLLEDPVPNISVAPSKDDLLHWIVTIIGPEGTPYASGKFLLDVRFPATYPFKAPTITFSTRIYHPNVNKHGKMDCDDSYKPYWSPRLEVRTLLVTALSLLTDPALDDAAITEPDIGKQYKTDRHAFEATARDWTSKYASSS